MANKTKEPPAGGKGQMSLLRPGGKERGERRARRGKSGQPRHSSRYQALAHALASLARLGRHVPELASKWEAA